MHATILPPQKVCPECSAYKKSFHQGKGDSNFKRETGYSLFAMSEISCLFIQLIPKTPIHISLFMRYSNAQSASSLDIKVLCTHSGTIIGSLSNVFDHLSTKNFSEGTILKNRIIRLLERLKICSDKNFVLP